MIANSVLYIKAALLGYAMLSLPYVALASDLRITTGEPTKARRMNDATLKRADPSLHSATSKMRDTAVNSTTVSYNVPEAQREVFYFRNFTLVGQKSSGFNITQWELDNFHPDRSVMTPERALEAGDSSLTYVASGAIVAVAASAVCIAFVPGCGAFVGANIGRFVQGLQANGGQAAVELVEAGLGAAGGVAGGSGRKRDNGYEGFGCYYQDGYTGQCVNEQLTDAAFDTIVNSDGSNNPPSWSCWESSSNGVIFGYYSHCFGVSGECELQCGAGNPEVNSPYNVITP